MGIAAAVLLLGWPLLTVGLRSAVLGLRFTHDTFVTVAAIIGFSVGFALTAADAAGLLSKSLKEQAAHLPFFATTASILACRLLTRKVRDARTGPLDGVTKDRLRPQTRWIVLIGFVLGLLTMAPVVWPQYGPLGVALAALVYAAAFTPESYWVGEHLLDRFVTAHLPDDARSIGLREIANLDTLLVEKSEVITTGECEITEVVSIAPETTQDELLHLAAIAEYASPPNPIRRAILRKAQGGFTVPMVKSYQHFPGRGVGARYRGRELLFGETEWLLRRSSSPIEFKKLREAVDERVRLGESVLCLSLAGNLLGAICLRDPLRPEAERFFSEVASLGLGVAVVSGNSAESLKWLLPDGVEVFGSRPPNERLKLIRDLEIDGTTVGLVAKKNSAIKAKALETATAVFELRSIDRVKVHTTGYTSCLELKGAHLAKILELLQVARRSTARRWTSGAMLAAYHLLFLPFTLTAAGYVMDLTFLPIFGVLLGAFIPLVVVPSRRWFDRPLPRLDSGVSDSKSANTEADNAEVPAEQAVAGSLAKAQLPKTHGEPQPPDSMHQPAHNERKKYLRLSR